MRNLAKQQMDYCTYCPKMCRFSCPVSETTKHETHTPWGKMQLAGLLLTGRMPWSHEAASALYQCTSCGRCQNYCEHHNDVAVSLWEARAGATEAHVAPTGVEQVEKHFRRHNNPYNQDLKKNLASGPFEELLSMSDQSAPVIFFPSCHTLRYFPERLHTYVQLFRKLNIPEIKLVEENLVCCAAPLKTLGWKREFAEAHEVHYHSLKQASLIISDEAECTCTLKEPSPTHPKRRLPAMHLLEFLAPYLEASSYQTLPQTQSRLVFHDPSFLSRSLKLDRIARNVLEAMTGVPPINLSLWGQDTWGSGAEGAYQWVDHKNSEKISKQILNELEGRRIKRLITASPQAEAQFKRLAKKVEVQDLFEFLNGQILEKF